MIHPSNNFLPELQFLLACLHQYFNDYEQLIVMPAKASIQAKVLENSLVASFRWHDTFQWSRFTQLVYRHKVTPLVYKVLKQHADTIIAQTILSELKSHCITNTYNALNLTAELIRVTKFLSDEGISSVVLKGQPLAKKLYGDPALRESCDIDILIPLEQLNKAHRLFMQHGYECDMFPASPKQHDFYLKHRKDFTYYNLSLNITIELHWRWFNNPKFFELSISDIWDTCATATLGDTDLKTLSSENEFLYLLAHASGHSWKYLLWLCDIRQMLHYHPDFNWSNLINRANTLGVKRSLIEGVSLSHQLFNTPLPTFIAASAREDKRISFLIKTSLAMLNRVNDPVFPRKQILSLRDFNLNQCWQYRLIFLKELFGMVPADWQLLKLDDKLFFFIICYVHLGG